VLVIEEEDLVIKAGGVGGKFPPLSYRSAAVEEKHRKNQKEEGAERTLERRGHGTLPMNMSSVRKGAA
jgi:hypothetical protein